MTTTARTILLLTSQGYLAESVERFNMRTRRTNDLFGFIDVLAICPDATVGVQTTTKSNLSARYRKIVTERRENALAWLKAGHRIILHGWHHAAPRARWHVVEREITLADFAIV